MENENTDYGIVYVLTNPAMPKLVKIGMTTRSSVEQRMSELFNTSIPVPFECQYACQVPCEDCAKVEKALHTAFGPYRVNPKREFFEIEPEQAKAILRLLDRSNDITREIAEEINNDLTPADRVSGENMKRKRRPSLNFTEMNIPRGSIIEFAIDDIEARAQVCADRKVLYNGTETSLTPLTRELLGLEYSVNPTPYWSYNGRNLGDIYSETYTSEE